MPIALIACMSGCCNRASRNRMAYTYFTVDADSAPYVANLTFPNYRALMHAFNGQTHMASAAATSDGLPVALALAVRGADTMANTLLSLYVDDAHRGRGVGRAVFRHLQHMAIDGQHPYIHGDYATNLPDIIALERLLHACDCQRKGDEMITVSGPVADGMALLGGDPAPLPPEFDLAAWSGRTADDLRQIIAYGDHYKENGWHNPLVDVGLLVHEVRDVYVVGWVGLI